MTTQTVSVNNNGLIKFIKNNYPFLTAGILVFLNYVPTFIWMWDRWFARDSYYNHGILIPFVTLYLIWQRKEELKLIEPNRSVWGIQLIILGVLIHVLSSLFRIYFTSGFSFIVVLIGQIGRAHV